VPVDGVVLAVSGAARPAPAVLSLRALGLGDFLTALPALRAVADAFPEHHRVVAMPAALEPLARRAGVADAVLPVEGRAAVGPIAAAFDRAVDVAVNLHGQGPESHRVLLALHPRRLVAFAHPDVAPSRGGPEWRDDEHEVARWCRLLDESGIPADPARLDIRPPPVESVAPEIAALVRGATVVHPGAASAARRWPADRWADVALDERRQGRAVVVTGGPGEVDVARWVGSAAGLPADAVLAGRTDALQLASVVAAAGSLLSTDTGVAHLATAVGTPSVVLFGPTPPSRWGPPAGRPIHRVLWEGTVGDPHGRRPHPGLLAITVDDVLAALAEARTASAVAVGRDRAVAAR
jgi:ADP-heptose:LPS heptosyltransferase